MVDGDEGVLQPVAARHVVVDVVGGYHADVQPTGQIDEASVALGVAADQVALELDEDAVRSEPLKDDALGMVGKVLRVELGVPAVAGYVGVGDEPAQVAEPLPGLGPGASGERHP